MSNCQIGSLTYTYAYYLQNGRQEANSLFCKLSWLVTAQPVIGSYIPVGTLISSTGQNACGLTNTEIRFAPTPPLVTFQILSLTYNGNPVVVGLNFSTLLLAMDDIIAALSSLTGVQWSYTQISEWEFLLCAPYTQNGDTVDIVIEVFSESSLGTIHMAVVLSGGVVPETPVYQTAADNCISVTQHDSMVETAGWIKNGVCCGDIAKPTPVVCESNSGDSNIELREDNDFELRESAN